MARKALAKTPERRTFHIKKGDKVRVIAGKDKNKEGDVITVVYKTGKVVVQNINVAKKAVRKDPKKNPQGGIINMPAPLDISNVMLQCPRCNKATRVGTHTDAQGKHTRKCIKCGELIDG